MKIYAMILQTRVIDVLKDQETEPHYPPDPSGNPVTAIPCDDTVTLGMIYDSETGTFSEYTPPEPESIHFVFFRNRVLCAAEITVECCFHRYPPYLSSFITMIWLPIFRKCSGCL